MPDDLTHASHLAVAAFADRDLELFSPAPDTADAGGPGGPILQGNPAAQRAERSLGDGPGGDADAIGLGNFIAGMSEAIGEVAIVSKQDQSAAVGVEAPDRIQATRVGDEPDDGWATLGVVGGAEDSDGLMQGVDDRLLCTRERMAVELDATVIPDVARGVADHLPVDADTSGAHERLGGASRGDTGVGEVLGEAHLPQR
jgi:hypothetical protein